jgi:hypothetical protein
MISPGLTRVENLDITALLAEASREDLAIFVLPFRGIIDHASLVAAFAATLPLDPPWGGRSWDALADCLWESLYQHPSRRMLVVWPGAGALYSRAGDDYLVVCDVFEQVAGDLADAQATLGHPKELAIVVERRHRDDALYAANAARLLRELVQSDCDEPFRSQLRAEVAACARSELPLQRVFETNTFSLVLDARIRGAGLRRIVADSPDDSALVTFDELARALEGAG